MTVLRGARHGRAKLTARQVTAIRRRYWYASPRPSLRGLAAQYGVSQQQVWRIVRCERWTHLASVTLGKGE